MRHNALNAVRDTFFLPGFVRSMYFAGQDSQEARCYRRFKRIVIRFSNNPPPKYRLRNCEQPENAVAGGSDQLNV